MSTVEEVESKEVGYGNLIEPKLPGFGRLGFFASAFLVLAAVMLMVLCLFSLVLAALWALFSVVVVAPAAFPTKDGYGRYWIFFRRRSHAASERSGRSRLQQGLVGYVPDGQCRLPGAAASTRLWRGYDIHDREFAMVVWPEAALYSVVLEAFPEGLSGVDKETMDSYVEYWAAWQGQLNTNEEVVGAAVVVETTPDSGRRLRRTIHRGRVTDAPELARTITEQIKQEYRVGSPVTRVWITLTLSGVAAVGDDSDGGEQRTPAEMSDLLGDLLPMWSGSLDLTGAGSGCRPCTVEQICDSTRVAFDPSVSELVEEAQLRSQADPDVEGTGITWEQAGPIAQHNAYDRYEHEGHLSRTWQMKEPPRGVFFAQTLQSMLLPHKDIARKRVAILYRPESPAMSAQAAENDIKKATFKATQGRRAKAAASVELKAAEKTSMQVALGAPLIRVGLLVTVTAPDEEALKRASRAVKTGLSAQARIALRLPKGGQDYNFVAALPLGMTPQVALRNPGKSAPQG